MQATLIYISEYMETKCMMKESRCNNEDLLVRLRAIFGHVDQIRDCIDRALQQINAHCRKWDMKFLLLPTWFSESMEQGDITVWINWICEETNTVMNHLEEERDARSDPDGPFNGTVNGVFLPLQDPLLLPPPVQTPKRNENNSEHREHSQKLWESIRKLDTADGGKTKNKMVTSTQGEPRKFGEHS